jgi:hypothetical protein
LFAERGWVVEVWGEEGVVAAVVAVVRALVATFQPADSRAAFAFAFDRVAAVGAGFVRESVRALWK